MFDDQWIRKIRHFITHHIHPISDRELAPSKKEECNLIDEIDGIVKIEQVKNPAFTSFDDVREPRDYENVLRKAT